MNADKYRQALINYAIPPGKRVIGNGLEVFQFITVISSTLHNGSEIISGEKNS